MLLGICGAEGSGKTTLANILTGNPETIHRRMAIEDPEEYVVFYLFGLKRNGNPPNSETPNISEWGLDFESASRLVMDLLRNNVDSDYQYPKVSHLSWYSFESTSIQGNINWVEVSLADSLKIVASIIFELDCDILMGKVPETRCAREVIRTKEYNICGSLTGREVLEYLGTNVFRNQFDDLFWVKIAMRRINMLRRKNINVVISDVRFENEKNIIRDCGGELIYLFKESTHNITPSDQTSHPAKWHYKKFINDQDLNITWYHNEPPISNLQLFGMELRERGCILI